MGYIPLFIKGIMFNFVKLLDYLVNLLECIQNKHEFSRPNTHVLNKVWITQGKKYKFISRVTEQVTEPPRDILATPWPLSKSRMPAFLLITEAGVWWGQSKSYFATDKLSCYTYLSLMFLIYNYDGMMVWWQSKDSWSKSKAGSWTPHTRLTLTNFILRTTL